MSDGFNMYILKIINNNRMIKNRLDNYLKPPLKWSFDAHRSQTLY
jgi:hypothetical protein